MTKTVITLAAGWSLAVFVLGCFGKIPEPHLPMISGLLVMIVGILWEVRAKRS